MSLTMTQAVAVLRKNVPSANVVGAIRKDDKYLFLAPHGDADEGFFDPFFAVDVETGAFRDWSPQNYDDPLEVINALNNSPLRRQ